jgi:O-antigen/teichoic acid export membrane protein
MIMAMITQAFRYAYEPFVFGKAKDKDAKEMYAQAMKYFVIFTLLAFLVVIGYMDVLRYIIGRDYWEGLRVVPIVMAAEIMMGIYFNLSFWYKLIDKTIWGAWFSGIGCAVLVTVNIVFVPRYGYMACAWGGFAGYLTCMVLSYLVGQKKNPISYPMRDILFYLGLTLIFFIGMKISNEQLPMWGALGVNTLIILFFAAVVAKKDLRLHRKA